MPAWSNISCAQWIERLRAPNAPASMIGERPAIRISGTRSRLALASMLTVLAVPTLTCTIKACGAPVTSQAPWAMATARFSCGTSTGRGTSVRVSFARAKPSTMGGKSVPGFTNRCAIPCRRSDARSTSPAVGGRAPGARRGLRTWAILVELDVGCLGDRRPARQLSCHQAPELLGGAAGRVHLLFLLEVRAHVRQADHRHHGRLELFDDPRGR